MRDGRGVAQVASVPRFYSVPELAVLPKLEWRVDDLLPDRGDAMLYGPKGTYKTFLALAIACGIVTGRPVLGRAVRQGVVLYIGLEGFGGFYDRLVAWASAHGLTDSDLRGLVVTGDPVLLHDPLSVAAFLAGLANYGVTKCALVIVDTLARASVGTDEKDNGHRDLILGGLASIRRALDCGTLLVHHTGWDETRSRGGSALPCGLDTILRLRDGPELVVEHHRDSESGLVLPFRAVPHGPSLAVVADDADHSLSPKPLSPNARKALEALARIELPGQGATNTAWEQSAGLPHGSFNAARRTLVSEGYVMQLKERAPWSLTLAGRALLGQRTNEGQPSDSRPSPPRRTDKDRGV